MESKSYFYVPLAKKADFNSFVRHIQSVIEILGDNSTENIADVLNEMLGGKELESDQVLPLLAVVLRDKWQYKAFSFNLEEKCNNSENLISTISTWKGVDIVIGYQHPDLGFLAINPKNPGNRSVIDDFRRNELVHVYVGKRGQKEIDEKLGNQVFDAIQKLLYNKKATVPSSAMSGNFVFKEKKAKPAPKKRVSKSSTQKKVSQNPKYATPVRSQASSTGASYEVPEHLRRGGAQVSTTPVGRKNMSQLISVVVSNELFHNGNVEAWKRIVRSYNATYPNAEVIIYYDGERIVDINTLFKWGKVKHGSTIQFAVAADEIKDLAKLRKYFTQGASSRFEDFLRGSPDTVLNLF